MPQEAEQKAISDPEHIAISKSTGVKIDWRDGHHSDYSLAWLRDQCPCATCSTARETAAATHTPPKVDLLPMFKPVLKMSSVEPIGQYAIRIYWNDGHSTGIYSFDHLRNICPCEECKARQEEE